MCSSDLKLLGFDEIKESLKTALDEQNMDDLGNPTSISIESVGFTYFPLENENDQSKISFVPDWEFMIWLGNSNLLVLDINAIDGSILYDYELLD